MRRKDKETKDPEAIAAVLERAGWGTLGLVAPGGRPVLVPLNFVVHQGRVCFHGAPVGEKLDVLRANPEASFLVVDPLAELPSYVFGPADAGEATQYYRSVIVYGQVGLVSEPERKAEILEALMKKYQPEGGYEPVTVDSPTYQASLRGVAVMEMTVQRTSGKFNLGQNLKPEERTAVLQFLERRGLPDDGRTLEAMAPGADSAEV